MGTAQENFVIHVEQRLKALNTNAFAVENSFGLPPDAVRSVLRGGQKSGTTLNRAAAICDALDLELYIGPRRETGPVEQLLLEGTDFAPIHRLNVQLSAGSGIENGDQAVVETLAFRRDWLARMRVNPASAVLVKVNGDSMQPGLHDGDLALVDTSQKLIRSGQIYAVTDIDAQTLVKRIDTLGGEGILLRSDNPDFAPLIRLGHEANRVTVHGRVVWSGHVWG
jgi:phage repressor protein C with HTH and peptisase S24 domain